MPGRLFRAVTGSATCRPGPSERAAPASGQTGSRAHAKRTDTPPRTATRDQLGPHRRQRDPSRCPPGATAAGQVTRSHPPPEGHRARSDRRAPRSLAPGRRHTRAAAADHPMPPVTDPHRPRPGHMHQPPSPNFPTCGRHRPLARQGPLAPVAPGKPGCSAPPEHRPAAKGAVSGPSATPSRVRRKSGTDGRWPLGCHIALPAGCPFASSASAITAAIRLPTGSRRISRLRHTHVTISRPCRPTRCASGGGGSSAASCRHPTHKSSRSRRQPPDPAGTARAHACRRW